jgi:lipoprotein NlpI
MRCGLLEFALILALGCAGCDSSNQLAKGVSDREACLTSDIAPNEALTACSRLISSKDERTLKRSSAYYNRGVAFQELREFDHARLDFEKALALKPNDPWARQRLDELEKVAN